MTEETNSAGLMVQRLPLLLALPVGASALVIPTFLRRSSFIDKTGASMDRPGLAEKLMSGLRVRMSALTIAGWYFFLFRRITYLFLGK
jgi:hypothetical protein